MPTATKRAAAVALGAAAIVLVPVSGLLLIIAAWFALRPRRPWEP